MREAVRKKEEATGDLIFQPDTTLLAVLGLFAELSMIKHMEVRREWFSSWPLLARSILRPNDCCWGC